MEKSTLLYFFSTCAQSIAALVGIVSAVIVFRYQTLQARRDAVFEKARDTLRESDFYQKISHFDYQFEFLKQKSRTAKMLIIKSKLDHLKKGALSNEEKEKLESWNYAFDNFEKLRDSIIVLVRRSKIIIGFGLTLALSAMALTTLPDLIGHPGEATVNAYWGWSIVLVYLFLSGIYFSLVAKLFSKSIKAPKSSTHDDVF